jgi:drug/metabolite transporter (DMT)-like permease
VSNSQAEAKPAHSTTIYLAPLGAILCWASLAAALYHSLGSLSPQQILTYGMGIAGLALLAWDWARGRPPWRTLPGSRGVLLGLYGIFGYHALLVGAFALAPPVQANILNYTWPLWIIVLDAWASKRKLRGRVLAGAAMGLSGAVIALEPWNAAASSGQIPVLAGTLWLGFGLALGAGFCWGSFTVLLRSGWGIRGNHADKGYSPMGWWCLLAAIVSAAWMGASRVPFAVSGGQLPTLLYIGLVPLGAAFPLWERATRQCPLNVLGLLSYLTPPLSTLVLGWAAGHSATVSAWIGLAVVLSGAALGGTQPRTGAVS